jgi:hypothetical protein
MNLGSPVQLVPTYFGFIESTYDALVLFEACLSGHITHVPRRPHDREREHVIKSGNIFIYEENTSGIKRWTDGISWSPSRILGNFLIYRQLQKPFGPGEKKKALKKPKNPSGISKTSAQNGRPKTNILQVYNNPAGSNGAYGEAGKMNPDIERALIGSLVDSYDFLDDGLVKKTISVTVNDVTHHLVSYYTLADAAARKFSIPSKDPKIMHLTPRPQLTTKQNFRGPIEEIDPLDRGFYSRNRYDGTNQSMLQQQQVPYLTSDGHSGYPPSRSIYNGSYSMPAVPGSYDNSPSTYSAGSNFSSSQYIPAPGIYPAPQPQQYGQDAYGPHRYSISSGASSDGSRAQMPATADPRRRSSIYPHSGSQDSGISMSADNRITSDTSTSNSSYYQRPAVRESSVSGNPNGNAAPAQRSLPSVPQSDHIRQMAYDRPSAASHYGVAMDVRDPSHMWPMGGNAGVGHAHYQQQWASAGN